MNSQPIDTKKIRDSLERYKSEHKESCTLRQFIMENLEFLNKCKNLKSLHQYLINDGHDVRHYKYFMNVYREVRKQHERKESLRNSRMVNKLSTDSAENKQIGREILSQKQSTTVKIEESKHMEEKPQEEIQYEPMKIKYPGGKETYICPITGAEKFKVE